MKDCIYQYDVNCVHNEQPIQTFSNVYQTNLNVTMKYKPIIPHVSVDMAMAYRFIDASYVIGKICLANGMGLSMASAHDTTYVIIIGEKNTDSH